VSAEIWDFIQTSKERPENQGGLSAERVDTPGSQHVISFASGATNSSESCPEEKNKNPFTSLVENVGSLDFPLSLSTEKPSTTERNVVAYTIRSYAGISPSLVHE